MSPASSISGLPETLREIIQKLESYGFTLSSDANRVWTLTLPPGHRSGLDAVGFNQRDLATGLLRVLREEEQQQGLCTVTSRTIGDGRVSSMGIPPVIRQLGKPAV